VDLVKSCNLEEQLRLVKSDIGNAIATLAKSEAFQKTWTRRNEFWNLDCAE
jgi:hypothetical protein